jgi:methylated-DNA-[protein]-cysteine S-methyltransferase
MIYYDLIPHTLVGNVFIAATEKGLCAVLVGDKTLDTFKKQFVRMFSDETPRKSPAHLKAYRKEIEEYFGGKRTSFTLSVDLSSIRSSFQRKVLHKLYALPFGRVVSYGELAERSGFPGAARAVGATMAANPLAVVIPCHRVVASGGGLGGYSAGLSMKKKLLSHEGVPPTRSNLLKARRR